MNEQPVNSDPQPEEWEMRVQHTARAFPYPPTPDIAGSVRMRMARPPRAISRRLAWAAILILVGLCALLAVPQVRAAVLEFIRIGAVRIFPQEPTATPGPTPTQPTPTPLKSILDLAGETTLSKAQSQVKFPIRLPGYPPDLGAPDHVFLQDLGGSVVVLVWMDPQHPDRVRLSLHQLEQGTFAMKGAPRVIQSTTIRGHPALWTDGPYVLQFMVNGHADYDMRRLVTGHVLIWEEGGITYRLETDVSLDEALKIAESLR
jgi:Domain of unknown function (DUF4367)